MTFPVGDLHTLSGHMNRLETMPDNQYDAFRQEAVSMILRQFSWETAGGEHDRLYRESLNR
jgi:hypothetical protein